MAKQTVDQLERARKLLKEMPPSQKRLWNALRQLQKPGLRFRREHRVGERYIDIYCAAARLAIEVDGGSHVFAGDNDSFRDSELATMGIKTVRILARDLQGNVDSIAHWIVEQSEARMV